MKRKNERSQIQYSSPWYLVVVFLLLTAGIIISGTLYYEHLKREIQREKGDELIAIAGLKAGQLSVWLEERMNNANMASANPMLHQSLVHWLNGDSSAQLQQNITTWMDARLTGYGYAGVSVCSADGKRMLSTHGIGESLPPAVRNLLSGPVPLNKVTFLDFHRRTPEGFVEAGVIIPVSETRSPNLGYIYLKIDPRDYFFPLIESWPTPSRTAETLLVRREGNEVLYVNELRHRKNTAFSLHFPITRQDLPAAMAVRGYEGVMEGYDDRGTAVLAAVKRVPDSPWHIIAEIDQEEVYAPIRSTAILIACVALFMIAAAGTSVGFWYKGQQVQVIRKRLALEKERRILEQRYDYLARYANDIILLADAGHKTVEVNDRALEAYGYTREEFMGMDMAGLRTPEACEDYDQTIKQVDVEQGLRYETIHQRRDGTAFPVEISMRVIIVEGDTYYQAIIRDISERKEAEQRLLHANRLYAVLSQVNQTIVRAKKRDELFREICRVAVDLGGFRMALIRLIDPDAHLFKTVAASGAELSFFDNVVVSSEDTPQGQSPIGIAIRETRIVASNDLFNYPGLFQWRSSAQELGCASSAAAPLVMHGRVIGAFAVYSSEPGFFNADEIGLLDEIAHDISYGLENIDQEAQRVQAEKALRTSEAKYHRLHDTMMDAFVWTDMDGRILECNWAYRKMLGYDLEELNVLTYRDITPEKWHVFQNEIVTQQIIPKGYSGIYEKEYRKKDGTIFPVELRTFLLKDDAGNPSSMWAIVRDITERKLAHQEREITIDFLKIVNGSTWIRDLVQKVTTFFQQQSGCEAVGIRLHEGDDYPYFEARGFPQEFVLAENSLCARDSAGCVIRDSEFNPIIECMCGNVICGRFDPEKPFFTNRGSFWTNSTSQLLASTSEADRQSRTRNRCNGEGYESVALIPLHIGEQRLGLLQLNDRRAGVFSAEAIGLWERLADHLAVALSKFYAEEALRSSEERFHRALENIPDVVVIYDRDLRIQYINPATLQISGRPISDFIGWKEEEIWPPEVYGVYLPTLRESLETRTIRSLETDLDLPGNGIKNLRITCVPLLDEEGEVREVLGITHDFTDRKLAEEEIRRLNIDLEQRVLERTAQLEATNCELEAFSYSVSHDLRAPLRAINGFTRILLDDYTGKLDSEGQRLFHIIQDNAHKMGQLIDDLLTFSRAGRYDIRPSRIEMTAMAHSIFHEVVLEKEMGKISLSVHPLPDAWGDSTLIRQVWSNLLSNAVKFASKNERANIEVGCRKEELEYVYWVKDNGVGFDMQYSHKLFGVFQRLHKSDEFEGTGVGLALVQRIIRRHGGRVWGEGEVGKGATFYFTLPMK